MVKHLSVYHLIPYISFSEYEELVKMVEQHYLKLITDIDIGGRFKTGDHLCDAHIEYIVDRLQGAIDRAGFEPWNSLFKGTNHQVAENESVKLSLIVRSALYATLNCVRIPKNWTRALDNKVKILLRSCIREFFLNFSNYCPLFDDTFEYFDDTNELIPNYIICESKLITAKALKRPQLTFMGRLSIELLKKIWTHYYAIRNPKRPIYI